MKIRRLVAYLIDWYLISFIMNLILVGIVYSQKGEMITNLIPINYFKDNEQLFILGLLFIVQIIYFCIIPCFVIKGQTIGKKILKIKIVNNDGSDVTFINLLKRDLLGIVLIEGSLMPLSNYLRNVLIPFVGRMSVEYSVYLFTIITIISIGLMMFGRNQKMLHDYIGSTKVVLV